ncbi:hypothetical protein OAK64_02915 [Deltaproteobacteria bacterium]|nr:hypothetical protein [Deltaproteobacteria bacterium]
MKLEFIINYKPFSLPVLLAYFIGIQSFLSACKTIDIKDRADLLPYMQKPVAFLTVKSPKNLETVWPQMIELIEQRLRELPSLGKVTGIKEQKRKFANNPKLRSHFRTYLSTLILTGISDKDIASKLEKELQSSFFLLLDFASFPCTKDCSSNEQWVIRLKLIEAHSGNLIFRVRKQYVLAEDEKTSESYNALAVKLTTEIVDEFTTGFIVPWHRWRYEHLQPASARINRAEIGI